MHIFHFRHSVVLTFSFFFVLNQLKDPTLSYDPIVNALYGRKLSYENCHHPMAAKKETKNNACTHTHQTHTHTQTHTQTHTHTHTRTTHTHTHANTHTHDTHTRRNS